MQKYKQKMRMEERANWIDTEMTQTDVMLEEICEKEEVAERTDETEKKKAKAEKETAENEVKSHGNIKWKSEKKEG